MAELAGSWFRFRTNRVLEASYGTVERSPVMFSGRARNFIGSLGVSFLTV